MRVIKGFEDEDIVVSNFGEWVGKNYIDYKNEYENNQEIIKSLLNENKQLKEQLQNISNEFLKYNWKEATQEQVYNQLRNLHESIFKGSDK